MSHASVIIALSPEEIDRHGGVEEAVGWNMEPFDENDEWFSDGSRWDYWVVGGRYAGRFLGDDQMTVGDIRENTEKFDAARRDEAAMWWAEAEGKDAAMRSIMFGIRDGESRDEYVDRCCVGGPIRPAFAFLRNRQWHEQERLGWFGGSVKPESGQVGGVAVLENADKGCKIVTHGSGEDGWDAAFWPTFIEGLPDDTLLVIVDYHV